MKNKKTVLKKEHKIHHNNSKIIAENNKKSIENSFDIKVSEDTEAYYSERYGWSLRKIVL